MKNAARIVGSAIVMAAGVGLAGLGAAAVAAAQPAHAPTYWWCPGQGWMPGWGHNWDQTRCHNEDNYDYGPEYGPREGGPWYP